MKGALVVAAGLFDLLAALFHIGFWRIFDWPRSLRGTGRVNALTIQVLNLVLIYVFLAYGGALLWLGGQVPALALLIGGGFFAFRLVLQPLFYGLLHPASKALAALALLGALLHLGAAFA